MDARILAGHTTSRTRERLRAVALAVGCCWVAGCLGQPLPPPGDDAPVDGAPVEDAPGADAPVEDAPGYRFAQIAYTKLPNSESEDGFGDAVALDGDILAVSMPGDDSAAQGIDGDQMDENAPDSGAVHVFRRSSTGWEPEAYVKASNTRAGDRFGWTLALDGDTLVVGAPYESSPTRGINAPESGAVYVFRRADTGWHQEAYIKPSDAWALHHFGQSLALDGDTLAVIGGKTPWVDVPPPYNGDLPSPEPPPQELPTVYVFRRNGMTWQEATRFSLALTWWTDASDVAHGRMALSGDTLATSAPRDAPGGGVHVFRLGDTTWHQEAFLRASNAGAYRNTGTGSLSFSASLALEGDLLAVGAPGEDSAATGANGDETDLSASDRGAVYVFRRHGTDWQQEAYVKPSIPGAGHSFGKEVAVDGNTLAIASDTPEGHGRPHGMIYLFRHDGTQWREDTRVTAETAMRSWDGGFRGLALSGDDLVIGAPGDGAGLEMDTSAPNSGAIYAFRRVQD